MPQLLAGNDYVLTINFMPKKIVNANLLLATQNHKSSMHLIGYSVVPLLVASQLASA